MAKFVGFVLKHAVSVSIVVAIGTALFCYGLTQLRVESSYLTFLPEDHPTMLEFERLRERFRVGTPMLVVWSCKETNACTLATDDRALKMAYEVSERLLEVDGIDAVASPASQPIVTSAAGRIDVRYLVNEVGEVVDGKAELVALALPDKQWDGFVLSNDGQVGAMVVQLEDDSSAIGRTAFYALRDILVDYQDEFRFHLAGDPVVNVSVNELIDDQMVVLMPLMIIALAAFLYLSFRSLTAVLPPLVMIGLTFSWSQGLLGLLDWPLTVLTQSVPTVLIALVVCTSVHFLARYGYVCRVTPEFSDTREDRERALIRASRDIGTACLLAALTTAGGFAAFYRSSSPKFEEFAVCSTFGILVALVLTFIVLPIWLARVSVAELKDDKILFHVTWEMLLNRVTDLVVKRYWWIIIVSVALVLVSSFGYGRLRIDIDEYGPLGSDSTIVRDVEWIADHHRKVETIDITFSLPPCDSSAQKCGIRKPETRAFLHEFSAYIESIDGVDSVVSAADIVRRAGDSFKRDGDPDSAEFAAKREEAAITFLMLVSPEVLSSWVSHDQQHLRITAAAAPVSGVKRLEILNQIETYLNKRLPKGWSASTTGSLKAYAGTMFSIVETQVASFRQALVNVGCLLLIFFFSVRWAFVGLLPTLLPVLCVLGYCGAAGIVLDISTAMLAPVVLGVGCDDSVHLVYTYREARRKLGMSIHDAVVNTIHTVGQSVVGTSVVLAAGFSMLAVSSMPLISAVSALVALAIVLALVFDLLLLPSLILASNDISERYRASRQTLAT